MTTLSKTMLSTTDVTPSHHEFSDVDMPDRDTTGLDFDSDEGKRLLRKLDWRLVPLCWLLYLLGYLDRANISNAKTGGLESDFNLTSDQYSIMTLLFFVSYLVFEIPSNMLLTRVKPHIYLPGLALFWGTVAACMGATHNWQQVAGLRFVLGIAEAGFAPGVAFYLSSWYRKHELATRYAIVYTAVPLAGGLSGLLAGVITEYMDGTAGIAGWRWLFILEGLVSIVAAVLVFFLLPDYPSNSSRFLNKDEALLACHRLATDGIALTQGASGEVMGHWRAFKAAVSDWRTWAQCLMFTLVTGAQTMQYFIPTLVASFGWKGHSGQYHTIPAYAAALVYVVGACYLADRSKTKWPYIAGLSGLGFVLFIAIVSSTNQVARYVLTIFAFGTIYGCSPLVKTWLVEVVPLPAEKRAVALALVNSIGNASSIYSSWLWPSSDAPNYIPGFATTTAWLGALFFLSLAFAWLFRRFPAATVDVHGVMESEVRAKIQHDEGYVAKA